MGADSPHLIPYRLIMIPKQFIKPPIWATRFLRWYCPNALLEEIEGDLYENFYRNLKNKGARYAKWRYMVDTLRFCNPVTFKKARNHTYTHLNITSMFRSFFISAVRNLKKNKVYAAINVLGLALGIACCVVIFVIVRYETSFDDYHSKADRIYRVNLNQKNVDGRRFNGCNYSPLADAIRREVTGLEAVTGVYCLRAYQINKEDNIYEDKYAFFADQEYFDVFDVAWIAGNQRRALTAPNSVVVTDVFAEKFLGGMDKALGNTFSLENRLNLTVTGIVEAPPTNTDHPYSILISYPSLAEFYPESVDNWETVEAGATYIVFYEDTQQDQIYPQLNGIINKYLKEDLAKNTRFYLMALHDNHDRNYDYNSFTYDFPVPVMVILSIIAGLIALIACINFVNLAMAQSLRRAKEVGIRKTLGSSRFQLILQYMSEAFVITLFAVMVGLFLSKMAMTQLNAHYGGNYLRFDFLGEPSIVIFMIGVIAIITVFAGFYPAFVLSGYRPVWALKSQQNAGRSKGFSLRKGLVVIQFVGAQMLILITIIMINQIDHFKERPLGFDPETVVVFPYLLGNEAQQYTKLDYELRQVPGIITHTFTSGPAAPTGGKRVEFHGDKGEESKHLGLINYADAAYLSTFNLELVAGRNFSQDHLYASSEVLVNQALVKILGMEDPEAAIGAIYTLSGEPVKIRGVIKDYYTRPMSNEIDPVTLQYNPEKVAGVAMKISTDHISKTLEGIEKAWKTVYPNHLCRYKFMDDVLYRHYGFFDVVFSFLGLASFLAIFIGCLGLYGLVSFMAVQRTKEIGIRKVLGASVLNIMKMFTKESIALILIAFVIAAPLAHMAGIALLMELPERINPGIGIFLITLMASLLVAWLAVGFRSFNAAVQSPVDSLRNE